MKTGASIHAAMTRNMPLIDTVDLALDPGTNTYALEVSCRGLVAVFTQTVDSYGQSAALLTLQRRLHQWYTGITRQGVYASELHGVRP